MLILTRHVGESIKIGDDVTVLVTNISAPDNSANVRIGIDAPQEVGIHRSEVYEENTQPLQESKPVKPSGSIPVFNRRRKRLGDVNASKKEFI
ncbi:MAG: carbon storage regulator [Planctomycetes bacterium]|nr:carbon storage regulator [Planctomycetota bacterium]